MKKKKIKSVPVEKRILFLCEYNSAISVFVSIQSKLKEMVNTFNDRLKIFLTTWVPTWLEDGRPAPQEQN